MNEIREQIKFLRISGSVLPPGSAEEIADSMEKMLAKVNERNKALETCRVKLEKLFDATGGIYHGGMEHSELIRWIKGLVLEEQTHE